MSEVKFFMGFIFEECFEVRDSLEGFDKEDIKKILTEFIQNYSPKDDQNEWFNKIKKIASE